uniref:Uncharacterized protein n=1 Tax=Strongyloides papillosus TaxID=174720 RepID=A0A0N5BFB2_STREA
MFKETYGYEYEAIIYAELSKIYFQLKRNISSVLNLKKKEKCYWNGLLKDAKYGSGMFSASYLNWYSTNFEIINLYNSSNLKLKANVWSLNFSIKLFKLSKIIECTSWVSLLIVEFYDFPIFWYKCIILITKCYLKTNNISEFVKCLTQIKVYVEQCKKRLVNDFFIRKILKECASIQTIINKNFPSHKNEFFDNNCNKIQEIDEFAKQLYNNSSDKEEYFKKVIAKKYSDFKILMFFCKWVIKNSSEIENKTNTSINIETMGPKVSNMLQYKKLLEECNLFDSEIC